MSTTAERPRTAELIVIRDPLRPDRTREVHAVSVGHWLSESVPADCLVGDWVAVEGGRVLARAEWSRHLLMPGAEIILYPRMTDTVGKIVSGIVFPPLGVYWALRSVGMPSWASGLLTGGPIGLSLFPTIETIMAGKPSVPNVPATSTDLQASPTYGFGGIQNSTRIGAPISVVYGTHRVGGQLIGYSVETIGDNDALNLLYAMSEGEIAAISSIEINDQPIANFSSIFVDSRMGTNTQAAIGLIGDRAATTFSAAAPLTTSFLTYTTQGTNLTGFVVRLQFPNGLFAMDGAGNFTGRTVNFEVDYKLTTSGTWTTGPREAYGAARRAVIRRQIRVDGLAAGQYDIRVRRTTTESTASSIVDAVVRDSITELVSDNYTYPNTALLAVRALATEQVSGGLPRVTAQVSGVKVKFWSFDFTYTMQFTHSPAWIVFDMLTNERYGHGRFTWKVLYRTGGLTVTNGSVNFSGTGTGWTASNLRKGDVLHDPVGQAIGIVETINYGTQSGTFDRVWGGASRTNGAYEVRSNDLDIDSFLQWDVFCSQFIPNGSGGFESRAECNFVFDAERENVWSAVLRICGVGQASLIKIGNYIRVKVEQASSPVQLFTMANIKQDSFEEIFLPLKERANVFEVQFLNEASGYSQDLIVLEDPLLFTNSEQPRRKTISGYGITRSSHAARLARFNRRVNQYVTRTITFEAGLDAVSCEPGDVIRFQHDIPQWGFGGRAGSGSTSSTIVLDRAVTLESGKTYEVLVRHDGTDSVEIKTVTTGVGTVTTLSVSGTWAQTPAKGEVWAFGPVSISTKPFRVVTIERTQELDARITAVEYVADVYDDSDIGNSNQVNYSLLGSLTGPPGPVKDLTLLGQDGAVQNVWVSFSPPGSANFHHANIYRTDSGAKVFLGSSANGSFAISNVASGTLVTVKVTSVSGLGVESDYAAAPTASIVALDQNPPDVPTLVLEGDRLRWNYPTPPLDLAGFLVRFRPGNSSNWESATPAHDNVVLTTDLQIFRRSGVQTYLVRAVDRAGNLSLQAKTLTVDFGLLASENIIHTTDHRALGWPGTFVGASVIAGDLKADASGTFWTADTSPMWNVNPTALMWTSAYSQMTYEFIVQPTADQADATLKLPLTMSGEWALEYRSDSSSPMWGANAGAAMWNAASASLMWAPPGDYTQWPGQLDHLREQQYFIRVTGIAGVVQAVLQQLSVVLDVPDKIETLNDVSIAAGGTRLALSGTPRTVVSVRVMLEDDGGTAAYAKVMDKDAALGPLIKVFNSSNVATTGLVDAVVHWY